MRNFIFPFTVIATVLIISAWWFLMGGTDITVTCASDNVIVMIDGKAVDPPSCEEG